MDTEQLKRHIKSVLPWLRWALQLQGWEITIRYEPIRGPEGMTSREFLESNASCRHSFVDKWATITLSPGLIDSPEEGEKLLLHELLHVFEAGFDPAFDHVIPGLPQKRAREVERLEQLGNERMVQQMEGMIFYGLGLGVPDLIRLAKKHAREHDQVLDEPRKQKKPGKT